MTPTSRETDQRVERFERACLGGQDADLADYLPPPDDPAHAEALRELACVDMELAARRGIARRPEHYLARFPALAADPDAAAELERQHRRLAEPARTAARPASWLEWAAGLHAEYRRGPNEPRPGDEVFGFRIVRQLGRGSFGQVYLAEQPGLASRLVALKVGRLLFNESQALAQLQHTNIMPIYSAHQDGPVQALCMPYLGSATLADVLREARSRRPDALVSTAARHLELTHPVPDLAPAEPDAPDRPAPDELRRLTHERAALWVAARLADGLAHAHDRGVVHRDLKPANVLIANDGTPLLLDFNLCDNARADRAAPPGGTLPYMAPEQMEAFAGGGGPVDARSDLYALGLILFELLAGRPPFPTDGRPIPDQLPEQLAARRAGVPPLRRFAPAVSRAAGSIVARCLAPDPAGRYQSARELLDDLTRQLEDRPLRHAPEPSLRERAAKFLRRRPRLLAAVAVGLALTAAAGVGLMYHLRGLHTARVEQDNARGAFARHRRDAEMRLALADPRSLDPGERAATEALAQLARLPEDERRRLAGPAAELRLLLARSKWLRASTLPQGVVRAALLAEAASLNAEGRALAGEQAARAFTLQAALVAKLAGDAAEAGRLLEAGRAMPLRTARDRHLVAGELYARGRARDAVAVLAEATHLDPSDAVAWVIRGGCEEALGRPGDAAASYTVGLALRPAFAPLWRWRGQARLAHGAAAEARGDLDQAVRLAPDDPAARTLRGLAALRLGHHPEAEADFTAALLLDPRHTRLHFLRSIARAGRGDASGAARDRADGLAREPGDDLSFVARGVARLPADPDAALADFRAALRRNPASREAAQNAAHVLSDHLGRTADAVELLDGLLEWCPDATDARIGRAVLLARLGRADAALADVAGCLVGGPAARVVFQAACAHARLSPSRPASRAEAVRLLRQALEGGFGTDHLETDPDLAPLRGDDGFRRLVADTRAKKAG